MSHSELDPEPSLRRDVRCFWTLEEEADLYNRDAILPDSSVEIVIACGAPLVMIDREGGSVPLPRAFVIGLQSRPLRLRATGLCQVVGMRVDPWSVGTFIDSPPLRDGVAPATGRWEKIAEHIAGRVRRRGYEEALAALGMVAEEERRRVARRVPPTIVEAGEMLREAGGAIGIENVAARCGISLSTLERGFREAAGLSPKAFARLVRFEGVRDRMIADPSARAVELAHDFGYADQAHLIHEFNRFAARTPGAFARQVRESMA